jgi:hypothetical protein
MTVIGPPAYFRVSTKVRMTLGAFAAAVGPRFENMTTSSTPWRSKSRPSWLRDIG